MYKWYQGAHVCVTYLAETVAPSDIHKDIWFTRGWTLQELLAPLYIKFYDADWNKLVKSTENDKKDTIILKQIEEATTITEIELTQHPVLLPISRRMQMAAKRQVTREEDSAYSLMGIFDVSIATAFGEGAARAFSRLLQAILNSSDGVVDVFNWAGPFHAPISTLLPPTAQGYLHRSHAQLNILDKPVEPIMLTHLGLRVTIVLTPAVSIQNPTSQYDRIGEYHAIAEISLIADSFEVIDAIVGGSYSVLDARISAGDGWKEEHNWYQLTFGILNVAGGEDQKIAVPKHCLGVGLEFTTNAAYKIPTEAPIIFTLNKKSISDEGGPINYSFSDNCYYIERSELANHGMKLVTLYL